MSYQTSYLNSYIPSERLGFSVKTPSPVVHLNRTAPAVVQKIIQAAAPTGVADGSVRSVATIPVSSLAGNTIFVSPSSDSTDSFILPTASEILSVFGRSVDTGAAKLSTGDCLRYTVVNKSSATGAFIYPGQTGADSSTGSIEAPTGGSDGAIGFGTDFILEFTNVGSSLSGATGSYIIYPVA
jgi:hypothetical protein